MSELAHINEAEPAVKGRISPRLREALLILVRDGCTQREAAERAGLKEHSLQRALAKPHVQAEKDRVKRARISGGALVAWHTVLDLAKNAASEDVRHKAARTVLEATGDLGGGVAEQDKAPRQLIQILVNPAFAEQPPPERLPGVTEAPVINGAAWTTRAELVR